MHLACQTNLFPFIPKDILGKNMLLVIASDSKERAGFLSFMHRKDLFKYHIDVAYFSRDRPDKSKVFAEYDYIFIIEPNASMRNFINLLVSEKSIVRNLHFWCLIECFPEICDLFGNIKWEKVDRYWQKTTFPIIKINKKKYSNKKPLFNSEDEEGCE
jgi:hypothetical protein